MEHYEEPVLREGWGPEDKTPSQQVWGHTLSLAHGVLACVS